MEPVSFSFELTFINPPLSSLSLSQLNYLDRQNIASARLAGLTTDLKLTVVQVSSILVLRLRLVYALTFRSFLLLLYSTKPVSRYSSLGTSLSRFLPT